MIDPVLQPGEYQALVLSYLADRDPAEVQSEFAGWLEAVVGEAGDRLRTRPAPGEWSALELLGHLVDAEVVAAGRYRWILAQEEPPLPGYDQDLWVARLHHNEADPEEMLALFRAVRRSNLELWRTTSGEERARVGIHAERGRESFDLTFRLTAGHGLLHLEQMRRTLAAAAAPES